MLNKTISKVHKQLFLAHILQNICEHINIVQSKPIAACHYL